MALLKQRGKRPAWSGAVWLALLGPRLLDPGGLRAEPAYPPVEAGVKAGYLLNFTKYTERPGNVFADGSAPVVIGVLGEDPFGEVLEQTVANRTSHGRKVVVRRGRSVQAMLGCHLIFISRSELARLPSILATLRRTPIVTVCDDAGLFELGVMTKLSLLKESVRFEVKLDPAEKVGLRFGSGMLDAAMRVYPNPKRA